MDYVLREHLAREFAGAIRATREEKWDICTAAAKASNLDPYVALARLLVRIVEDTLDEAPPSP